MLTSALEGTSSSVYLDILTPQAINDMKMRQIREKSLNHSVAGSVNGSQPVK
jgi:hypothetical protein